MLDILYLILHLISIAIGLQLIIILIILSAKNGEIFSQRPR